MQLDTVINRIVDLGTVYGINIIAALAIFIIGRWVAGIIKRVLDRVLDSRKVDPTLVKFVCNLAYVGLLAFVVIAALSRLGIQTTAFIAVLGAAGLAIGLALQGSLSNFAAGVLLIIFRPIRVGDFVETAGTAGTVEEISIFTTQLKTPDNKTVIVPNSGITDGNIVNYTVKGTRRADLSFGIGYGDDIDKARSLISDVIAADDRIHKDPAPLIAVAELADSSVNFAVRVWVSVDDYWGVVFDTTEKVKKCFDANGVSIPFPQQDVHLYKHAD